MTEMVFGSGVNTVFDLHRMLQSWVEGDKSGGPDKAGTLGAPGEQPGEDPEQCPPSDDHIHGDGNCQISTRFPVKMGISSRLRFAS